MVGEFLGDPDKFNKQVRIRKHFFRKIIEQIVAKFF